jgi:K+-sensing histidine kinase KdpD
MSITDHHGGRLAVPPTHFAPPERASEEEIARVVRQLSSHEFITAMLDTLGGWVAIVNRHRQVVAVNHALLHSLGIGDPSRAMGLRPGEALKCVHAADHPAGCGTGRFCETCGAVVAMLACQKHARVDERECVLTCDTDGVRTDRDFLVRCSPLRIEGHQLMLLCMRDISEEKRRGALERAFLHDLSNVLTALGVASSMIRHVDNPVDREMLGQIREAAEILMREVKVQRLLTRDRPGHCRVDLQETSPRQPLQMIERLTAAHPSARGQRLKLEGALDDGVLETDTGLLTRILTNMVLNAFEAGQAGDEVRVAVCTSPGDVCFEVWNRAAIPEHIRPRVFQRYFSTKPGSGRGLGTSTMKLLGEEMLRGEVGFTSDSKSGTTFYLRLPRRFPG